MASEQLMAGGGPRYVQMQSEPSPSIISSFFSFRHNPPESTRMFDELPKATIIEVSRPDAGDISPVLLSYTIEFRYKQVRSLPVYAIQIAGSLLITILFVFKFMNHIVYTNLYH